jgi:RNA polymerase sigma-70 factor (ECF subfamily)
VTWLQPYPDAGLAAERRETVELAFITALQRLPPRQTAAVILCDVLDFSATEAAALLEVTPTALKGLLQRARAGLHREPADGSYEPELARRFAEAFSADDVDGVVALLTEDAWLRMPPAPHEYQGRAAIAAFLRASAAWRGQPFALEPAPMNRQPGFRCTLAGRTAGCVVIAGRGDRIAAITRFLSP